jgi:predicted DNA-binding protein (UPF0251 family)
MEEKKRAKKEEKEQPPAPDQAQPEEGSEEVSQEAQLSREELETLRSRLLKKFH